MPASACPSLSLSFLVQFLWHDSSASRFSISRSIFPACLISDPAARDDEAKRLPLLSFSIEKSGKKPAANERLKTFFSTSTFAFSSSSSSLPSSSSSSSLTSFSLTLLTLLTQLNYASKYMRDERHAGAKKILLQENGDEGKRHEGQNEWEDPETRKMAWFSL